MPRHIAAISFVLLFCSTSHPYQASSFQQISDAKSTKTQESTADPIEFNQQASLTGGVVRQSWGYASASVALGVLNPQTKYKLRLSLKNSTQRELSFDEIKTSCGCANATAQKTVVPPSEVTEFVIEFTTPKSDSRSAFSFSMTLASAKSSVARVNFQGDLAGNLHIPPRAGFMFVQDINEYLIPVAFTEPVSVETLEISVSPELRDSVVVGLSKQSESTANLDILLDGNKVETSFLSGSITLRQKALQKSASIDLVFRRKQKVAISPLIIQFHPESQNSEVRTANALLQVDEDVAPKGKKPPILECTCDRGKIAVTGKAIRRGIYRLKFSTKIQTNDEKLPLSVSISTPDIKFRIQLFALVNSGNNQ